MYITFCLSAVLPDDYAVQNGGNETFPACTPELCFLITTVNDELVEEDEEFYISLSSGPNWDNRVYLNQTTAKVTIIDNDSKFGIGVKPTLGSDFFFLSSNICNNYALWLKPTVTVETIRILLLPTQTSYIA